MKGFGSRRSSSGLFDHVSRARDVEKTTKTSSSSSSGLEKRLSVERMRVPADPVQAKGGG